MKQTTQEIHLSPHEANPHAATQKDLLAPDVTMVVLTWVTFFLLLAVLKKFAWKPILEGLDEREESIRRSLEDADRIQKEMNKLEETKTKVLTQVDAQAKDLIAKSRKGAAEAAKHIEQKAKEDAQIILTNADHEIRKKSEKAHIELRQESVDTAIGLLNKILDEELDEKKHKKLIDKFIEDFDPKKS